MGSEKREKKERKHEKKDKKKKDKSHKHKKKKSDKKEGKKKDSKHSKKRDNKSSSSSSSDDEPQVSIGPAMPPGNVIPVGESQDKSDAPNIGPALPPGVVLPSSNDINESDSEDDAGPSLGAPAEEEQSVTHAESHAHEEQASASHSGQVDGESKRRAGPALPEGVDLEKIAAQAAKVDWEQVAREEEEEEEDLVGPAMPGQVTRGYVAASIAAEQRALSNAIAERERELNGDKPKHEEWMTVLPDVKALGFTIDQMQQNRTFQRKEHVERGDTSAWTDTPEEKERKKREKAMGIKRKLEAGPVKPDTTGAAVSIVQQYNAAVRPKSLVEIHQEEMSKKKRTEGGAQATPGGWDRSEITQARQKDAKSVEKMFEDARTLGGRFGGGSFHGI